jgi:hypothetical protein
MNQRRSVLSSTINILASAPEVQLRHLAAMGLPERIDEIALDFDAIAAASEDMLRCGELNEKELNSLKRIDFLLSAMSGSEDAVLWTPEGLRTAPEWTEVRRASAECLRLLTSKQSKLADARES